MQAVIYIFQCPKGRVYAGWRGVSPEALRAWPNRGSGPLPCGYTGSGNPWRRIARRHKAALVWRILARVDGTQADVDAAEVRAIRLARAVFGQRCVNVADGGQGLSSEVQRQLWADPAHATKTLAALAAARLVPGFEEKRLARLAAAMKDPAIQAKRLSAAAVAMNDAAYRDKQRAQMVRQQSDPTWTTKNRAQLAGLHNDPTFVDHLKRLNADPEIRALRSAQGKARNQTPEGAAAMARMRAIGARKHRARKALAPFIQPPTWTRGGAALWAYRPPLRLSLSVFR